MIELNFQKSTEKEWPVKAQNGEHDLIFKGSFFQARVRLEERLYEFKTLQKLLCWSLAIAGIICLILSAHLGIVVKDTAFILRPSLLNLFFFLGLFAGFYIWAESRQAAVKATGF